MSREAMLAIDDAIQSAIKGIHAVEDSGVGELPPEETDQDEWLMEPWDDTTGKELKPQRVKMARREEVTYSYKMKMYDKVPISDCIAKTGQKPIGVR